MQNMCTLAKASLTAPYNSLEGAVSLLPADKIAQFQDIDLPQATTSGCMCFHFL